MRIIIRVGLEKEDYKIWVQRELISLDTPLKGCISMSSMKKGLSGSTMCHLNLGTLGEGHVRDESSSK